LPRRMRTILSTFPARIRTGRLTTRTWLCNREIIVVWSGSCTVWVPPGRHRPLARFQHTPLFTALLNSRGLDQGPGVTFFTESTPLRLAIDSFFRSENLRKSKVRCRLAHARYLPGWYYKPDSTGICFIADRPFQEIRPLTPPRGTGPYRKRPGSCGRNIAASALYTLVQRSGPLLLAALSSHCLRRALLRVRQDTRLQRSHRRPGSRSSLAAVRIAFDVSKCTG